MTAPAVIAPVVPRTGTGRPHRAPDGATPPARRPLPLPEPPPQRTSAVVYGAAAVDDRGRVVERVVLRALGWPAGHRLTIDASGGTLNVTPDPTGGYQVSNQGFLRIPAELRYRCGLAIGDRVLLAADPDRSRLTLYTPAALDAVLPQRSTTRPGGEPA